MSWGSGAPSRATGAFTPVCTWEIQSKRMARILQLTAVPSVEPRAIRVRCSSRKTSHLAVVRTACLPSLLIGLPQRSSSSNMTLVSKAAASALAPASPMQLSRRERRRRAEPGAPRTAARACAPASPMPLPPRQSSPRPAFWGEAMAKARARAPMSPRLSPLSSSSRRSGGASRHSKRRAVRQTPQRRARDENVGRRSMML
mmetsp:Transcript_47963/g.137769  ORF Transcript_47963/g.137769 Transcript_47963/m.137769 type:complete len:201 (+) Transcript_47963:869-1471(+)